MIVLFCALNWVVRCSIVTCQMGDLFVGVYINLMSKTKLISKSYLPYREQHEKAEKKRSDNQHKGQDDDEDASIVSPIQTAQVLDYYDFNNSYYLQQQNYTIEDFIQNLQVEYYDYYREEPFQNQNINKYSNRHASFQAINAEYKSKMGILQQQEKTVKRVVRFRNQQQVKYFKEEMAPSALVDEQAFVEELDDQQQDLSNDCCL